MNRLSLLKIVSTILMGYCIVSAGQTVVLQNGTNGYSGATDTYIVDGSEVATGASDKLVVEGYHCGMCVDQRVLIRFDCATIPANSQISKATLSLYSNGQPRPGSSTVNVHTLSAAWDESQATWTKAKESQQWKTPGGDYIQPPAASYQYGEELNVWHTVDVTAQMKEFIKNPQMNNGLMLYMEPIMHTVTYVSSNAADREHRPKLTFEGQNLPITVSMMKQGTAPVSIHVNHGTITLIQAGYSINALSIETLKGRQILSVPVIGVRTLIDAAHLSSGMYVITAKSTNQAITSIVVPVTHK
ncbi:MAG: DNRLRE domain-containing protein [Chitinivibrionales bacterium]|nr:DNRLRE domain-containing protein [Chitinivibrionales bacterium]